MNKKITAIGLAAGLLAGAGAGLVLELSGDAGAAGSQSVMVAADQTGAQGAPADVAGRLQEVLKPLVDDGTLTQAQADKVIAALQAAGPMAGQMGGPMGGRRGRGDHGMSPQGHLDTVATVLGLTVDEVRSAVQGGTTIAELATQHGSTAQAVIDALVADVQAHFDAEVASGEHTQADADSRIADAKNHITEFVNNTQAAMAQGGMRPGGMGDDHMGPDDGMGGAGGMMGGAIDGGPGDGGPTDTVAP